MSNCVNCSKPLTIDEKLKIRDLVGVSICDECAKKVANAYALWHSGETLDMKLVEPELVEIKKKYSKKSISQGVQLKVFRRDGFKCKKCGSSNDLTVDHVIPESKGGPSDLSNYQTLCRSCNSSKGTSYDV